MANLSKASNIVQEKYVLYDVTSFTQKWHSIPVATNLKYSLSLSLSLRADLPGHPPDPLSRKQDSFFRERPQLPLSNVCARGSGSFRQQA